MDDQELILEAISALLGVDGAEHGIKVVACAKDYQQVLQAVQEQQAKAKNKQAEETKQTSGIAIGNNV